MAKLSDDQVGDGIVDRRAYEHDPVLQEQREDVVAALAPGGLLDHHWDDVAEQLVIKHRAVHQRSY